MNLHVTKHPDPKTLANCVQVKEGEPPPEGSVEMTVGEYEEWKVAELLAGWKPAVDAPPSLWNKVKTVVGRIISKS